MTNDKNVGDLHSASASEDTSHATKQTESETQVTPRDNGGAGTTDSTINNNGASNGAPEIPQESETPAEQQPPSRLANADPFDPMNLGISTDYAAAISAQASTKPVELRKPNNQEFFRTSPHKHQRVLVGSIEDKQDMSKLYVVHPSVLDGVMARFPKHVRHHDLVLTQSLIGNTFLWGVPRAEDKGGSWNSTQRESCFKGQSHWTNMASGHGKYDVTTINNPKEVDWNSFPPMVEFLHQALSDGRLINSMDHPLLLKLGGELE
jgi:hypothetical protein